MITVGDNCPTYRGIPSVRAKLLDEFRIRPQSLQITVEQNRARIKRAEEERQARTKRKEDLLIIQRNARIQKQKEKRERKAEKQKEKHFRPNL